MKLLPIIFFTIVIVLVQTGSAQPTGFSYQGSLTNSGGAANGNFDFEFALFTVSTGGTQLTQVTHPSVPVANGAFAVVLDFGSVTFATASRFLEIRVRPTGGGSFTPLTPRTPIISTPFAIRSITASNAIELNGVAADQYVVTTDPRMTDPRAPTAGSGSYIQNQNAAPQFSSSFSISGSGTAGGTLSGNNVNAVNQYNIGGSRVLAAPGTNVYVGPIAGRTGAGFSGGRNVYVGNGAGGTQLQTTASENTSVGVSAGFANLSGIKNSIFGANAGFQNLASNNSFFGAEAGEQNSSGTLNAFFGYLAGNLNSIGNSNSFFGAHSGESSATGGGNSFFGESSGRDNMNGIENSFFGVNSGRANTSGNSNSYLGRFAGRNTSTGSGNTMVGVATGLTNISGSSLTLIGANSNVGSDGLTFATAIGAGAVVTSSDTVQIGRGIDTVNFPGKMKLNILGGAGATALCRNASAEIATCSSSARYKSNIGSFSSGLEVIKSLRPVFFTWREGGMQDLGLVAEEVAKVEPLLTTTNDNGGIEGVKYDRIGVVLVNAVKEQQTQIESLRKMNAEQDARLRKQDAEIAGLKALVCATNTSSDFCRPQPK